MPSNGTDVGRCVVECDVCWLITKEERDVADVAVSVVMTRLDQDIVNIKRDSRITKQRSHNPFQRRKSKE